MTYEELLSKIKREEDFLKTQCFDGNLIGTFTVTEALRAVVELHQQLDDNACRHCVTWYPCETIQAIEKELQ